MKELSIPNPQMSDREVDLSSLSTRAVRSLCREYRELGLIPPTTHCDMGEDPILRDVLGAPVDYVNARVRAEQQGDIDDFSQHVPTYITLSINADILSVIGQYVDYDVLLALVAAYPAESLVKALYNPMSLLWDARLWCLTGRGCLKDPSRPTRRSLASPWSIKAQHDAALPRSGYLIVSALERRPLEYGQYQDARIMVHTNRRVKGLVDRPVERYSHHKSSRAHILKDTYHLVALWEDGTVRHFIRNITVLSNGNTDVRALKTAIEDDSYWTITLASPRVQLSDTEPRPYAPPNLLPKMRMMAPFSGRLGGRLGRGRGDRCILCLDYDGDLWYGTYRTPDPTRPILDYLPTMARVTPMKTVGQLDIGRIIHFTIVEGEALDRTKDISRFMAVVTNESGEDYLLDVNPDARVWRDGSSDPVSYYMPIYYPLGDAILETYYGDYGGRTSDGQVHNISALDVPNEVPTAQLIDFYPPLDTRTPYIIVAGPEFTAWTNIDMAWRYDDADEAAPYIQIEYTSNFSHRNVATPIVYDGIAAPALYDSPPSHRDVRVVYDHISNLGYIAHGRHEENVEFRRIQVYPRWNLGMVPSMTRVEDPNLSSSLSNHYIFIQARYATSSLSERLALLGPDGSVTLVGTSAEKNTTEVPPNTDLHAQSVDLTMIRGGNVAAMVYVASARSGKKVTSTSETVVTGTAIVGIGV